MLLVGAGLLVRSVIALNRQDPGFASTGVLTLRLDLPEAKYTTPERVAAFYEQLIERLSALPGVESSGAGSSLLLSRLPASATINIEGRPPLPADAQNIPVPYDSVTPGYFATLQIPLRRGRMFTAADAPQAQEVVLVNESFVRRFFPNEDPLGRRVTFGDPDAARQPVADDRRRRRRYAARRIRTRAVGGDLLPDAAGADPRHVRASPHRRRSGWRSPAPRRRRSGRSIATRRLPASARSAICSRRRRRTAGSRRCCSVCLPPWRSCSRPLASTACSPTRRHSGRRRSASAWRSAPTAARFCGWCSPAARGSPRSASAIGIAGALALTQVLSGLLFGVSARDPLTFLVVPGALLAVALAACWIPARRAIRVEPVIALRGE